MRLLVPALVAVASFVAGPTKSIAQSPEQVERLATLGQVWGFLKYFHPGVAGGSIHWDSALVATVPKVKAARTTAEFNAVVQSLLDAAGGVRPCALAFDLNGAVASRCREPGPDSTRNNVDLRWLTNSKILNADIVRQLVSVRDNRHFGSGRYVYFRLTAMFDRDTAFGAPAYPGEGVRLLALFRFWNAARYYFPYMYVNGGDWNAVLPAFIPRLIAATNAAEYHLTVVEMTSRLNDAHVGTNSPQTGAVLGTRTTAFEARSIERQVVVTRIPPSEIGRANGLQVGDVITHVDGQAIAQRRRELTKYIAAGNPAVLERKLVSLMLRSRSDSATYTIERNGESLVRRAAMAPPPSAGSSQTSYPVTELAKVLPNSNIGYVNMGDVNLSQVDSVIEIVRNTGGLVMDVRNYPRGTMYRFAEFLNPESRSFVKFTGVDSTFPGQVVWTEPMRAGRVVGNANAYRGRVAILVDERTQSHAEFTTMALQTSPQNKVIGSQTAGADGNVTYFNLPGGIRTLFTGLGVFYPDGRATQRIGIVPDIEVRPTIKGIRAGRDEVLDRAIEYLRTGR